MKKKFNIPNDNGTPFTPLKIRPTILFCNILRRDDASSSCNLFIRYVFPMSLASILPHFLFFACHLEGTAKQKHIICSSQPYYSDINLYRTHTGRWRESNTTVIDERRLKNSNAKKQIIHHNILYKRNSIFGSKRINRIRPALCILPWAIYHDHTHTRMQQKLSNR